MIFFARGNQIKHQLIFDVGSSKIILAQVLFHDSRSKPDIKRILISENVLLPEVDLRRLWRKISRLFDKIMQDYKENVSTDVEALIVFSSPWYYSEIQTLERKFDFPQKISKDFLEEMIEIQEKSFKKEELTFMHSRIISAKLNGYPLKEPERNISGKSAKEIFVSIYTSAFFREAALYFKKILEGRGIRTVEFQSSPWVIFDVLMQEGYSEVAVVDVGGEVTEIMLVKDGQMRKIASFGRGFNYLARRVGSALHLGLEEAASLLLAYEENKLETKMRSKVSELVKESIKDWQKLFQETVETHMPPDLMPKKIILTGRARLAEFSQALNSSFLDLMELYIKYAAKQ